MWRVSYRKYRFSFQRILLVTIGSYSVIVDLSNWLSSPQENASLNLEHQSTVAKSFHIVPSLSAKCFYDLTLTRTNIIVIIDSSFIVIILGNLIDKCVKYLLQEQMRLVWELLLFSYWPRRVLYVCMFYYVGIWSIFKIRGETTPWLCLGMLFLFQFP